MERTRILDPIDLKVGTLVLCSAPRSMIVNSLKPSQPYNTYEEVTNVNRRSDRETDEDPAFIPPLPGKLIDRTINQTTCMR